MLNISEFRHIINIERLSRTVDAYGASKNIYTLHLTLKASVKYSSGNKTVDNDEKFNVSNLKITTHWRDIKDTDLVVYKGLRYKINYIEVVDYNVGLILYCEKINE